jgi:hypothetical protein
MIDLLVQHHADVNARDRRRVTVLAKAIASGAADLAERLRSLGALTDRPTTLEVKLCMSAPGGFPPEAGLLGVRRRP